MYNCLNQAEVPPKKLWNTMFVVWKGDQKRFKREEKLVENMEECCSYWVHFLVDM
jgi:hypothetical protein